MQSSNGNETGRHPRTSSFSNLHTFVTHTFPLRIQAAPARLFQVNSPGFFKKKVFKKKQHKPVKDPAAGLPILSDEEIGEPISPLEREYRHFSDPQELELQPALLRVNARVGRVIFSLNEMALNVKYVTDLGTPIQRVSPTEVVLADKKIPVQQVANDWGLQRSDSEGSVVAHDANHHPSAGHPVAALGPNGQASISVTAEQAAQSIKDEEERGRRAAIELKMLQEEKAKRQREEKARLEREEQERIARKDETEAHRKQRIAKEKKEKEEQQMKEKAAQQKLKELMDRQEKEAREQREREEMERREKEEKGKALERERKHQEDLARHHRLQREAEEQAREEMERAKRMEAEWKMFQVEERSEKSKSNVEDVREKQARKAKEEAAREQQAKIEREKAARLEQERMREEKERRDREEQEKLARVERERKVKEEEETRKAREDQERMAREEEERIAREEQEKIAREQETIAREERERIEREEQERVAREEAESFAREEQEKLVKEQERIAREREGREEAERLAREEREKVAHEEQERIAREEEERREQARVVLEEQERRIKEERVAREEAERMEQGRLAKEEEEKRVAKEEAERIEQARLAKEVEERKAREETERAEKAEAERIEQERIAREVEEKLVREEQERIAKDAEKVREEAERVEHERIAQLEREREEKERIAREEQEKLAREAQEREREDQERVARQEKERLESEEQAKKAKEEQAKNEKERSRSASLSRMNSWLEQSGEERDRMLMEEMKRERELRAQTVPHSPHTNFGYLPSTHPSPHNILVYTPKAALVHPKLTPSSVPSSSSPSTHRHVSKANPETLFPSSFPSVHASPSSYLAPSNLALDFSLLEEAGSKSTKPRSLNFDNHVPSSPSFSSSPLSPLLEDIPPPLPPKPANIKMSSRSKSRTKEDVTSKPNSSSVPQPSDPISNASFDLPPISMKALRGSSVSNTLLPSFSNNGDPFNLFTQPNNQTPISNYDFHDPFSLNTSPPKPPTPKKASTSDLLLGFDPFA